MTLQQATTYVCDDQDRVICKQGWRRLDYPNWIYRVNPCPIPICDWHGVGCLHGTCIGPNTCSCDEGW